MSDTRKAAHHGEDKWDGDDYLNQEGMLVASEANTRNVLAGLKAAGFPEDKLKSLNCLEIGSGPGAVTRHLLPLFGSVHSIDTSPSMLKTLSKQSFAQSDNLTWSLHALGADTAAAFKTALPSPKNGEDSSATPPRDQFDVAISTLTVHHVDDTKSFFAGAKALLKPGGVLVICEFTKDAEGNDVLAALREKYPEMAHGHAGSGQHDHGHDHKKETKGHEMHEGKHGGDSQSKGHIHDRGHAHAHGHAHHDDKVQSVNAPGHFHPSFEIGDIRKMLQEAGFTDIEGGNGEPVVIPKFKEAIPCIWVFARKPGEGWKGD
ncbi:Methyltransferase type 12 [Trichosporon asahii var. asahii CBS 8904]|uniref:Methyltransferase type 12 n=1 Tax=Trichosporon asahii var. asahii (strain CBS 8904) TaxID=1220162 RepID=K1VEY3_TRIAC|nr:Methyltransferase type 12 [Trichosporon asahii var. asahii CBS 8904]